MMTDKIHILPTGDASKAEMEKFKRLLPEVIEWQKAMAELRYATYQAQIDAGFTEDQALVICKDMYR